jgi:hypothetical protein
MIVVFSLCPPSQLLLSVFPSVHPVHLDNFSPYNLRFNDNELKAAMGWAEAARRAGHRHVCISSEPNNCVGQMGVSSVEDGKTPDGVDYDWKKRRA